MVEALNRGMERAVGPPAGGSAASGQVHRCHRASGHKHSSAWAGACAEQNNDILDIKVEWRRLGHHKCSKSYSRKCCCGA